MDTAFMDAIVASGTTMLTSLVGALFSFIVGIIPILLGLAAVGFVVWGIRAVLHYFRSVRRK